MKNKLLGFGIDIPQKCMCKCQNPCGSKRAVVNFEQFIILKIFIYKNYPLTKSVYKKEPK